MTRFTDTVSCSCTNVTVKRVSLFPEYRIEYLKVIDWPSSRVTVEYRIKLATSVTTNSRQTATVNCHRSSQSEFRAYNGFWLWCVVFLGIPHILSMIEQSERSPCDRWWGTLPCSRVCLRTGGMRVRRSAIWCPTRGSCTVARTSATAPCYRRILNGLLIDGYRNLEL